jgi:pimeloyl-ACP methyl ester carboxylesterase
MLPARAAMATAFANFHPAGSGTDPVNSYLLAVASNLAYPGKVSDRPGATRQERFRYAFDELGLELAATIETDRSRNDIQALVLSRDDLVLVVFRGSESSSTEAILRDWLDTDSKIKLVPFGDVLVHKGFSLAFEASYENLVDRLRPLLEGRNLWLTGHSLGGALANLTALQMARDRVPVHAVVTFASPRVGDQSWADTFMAIYGSRSQHWVHERDPIARLPWATEERPYRNVGPINLIAPSSPARLDAELGEMGLPYFAVHSMKVYSSLLFHEIDPVLAASLPSPEPICPTGHKVVGQHPEDRLPLCRRKLARAMPEGRCLERGGEVVDEWCALPVDGRRRYRAHRIE